MCFFLSMQKFSQKESPGNKPVKMSIHLPVRFLSDFSCHFFSRHCFFLSRTTTQPSFSQLLAQKSENQLDSTDFVALKLRKVWSGNSFFASLCQSLTLFKKCAGDCIIFCTGGQLYKCSQWRPFNGVNL